MNNREQPLTPGETLALILLLWLALLVTGLTMGSSL